MQNDIFEDCLKSYNSNDKDLWKRLSRKYNIKAEILRSRFLRERKKRGIPDKDRFSRDDKTEYRKDGSVLSQKIIDIKNINIDDPESILVSHGFNDTKKWEIVSYKRSIWNNKQDVNLYSSGLVVKPKYQPSGLPTTEIINKIFENIKPVKFNTEERNYEKTGEFLIIPIADFHFGLMASISSSNNEYNISIAESYYKEVIQRIVGRIKLRNIGFEKIVLVCGNDFLNFDNLSGTTTAGTPQDNDALWFDVVNRSLDLLIGTINTLIEFSPVEVVYVPSNHDLHTTFTLMKMLDCYYHGRNDVTIDTSNIMRKYIMLGKSMFAFAHDIPVKNALEIITTEKDKDWSSSYRVYLMLAHLHQSMSYEKVGKLEIFRLPSLSGMSRWSNGKGYVNSERKVQCFVVNRYEGITDIINLNI